MRSAIGWTIDVQASYAGFGRLRQEIDGPVASHCEHESREITDRDYALNFKNIYKCKLLHIMLCMRAAVNLEVLSTESG